MMVGNLDIIRKDAGNDDSDDDKNNWMEYNGTFYQKDCHVYLLVPSKFKTGKKQDVNDKRKVADLRDLDILVKLSKQESCGLVKELLAYSYTEPAFYITENFHCDTLQSVLSSHRKDEEFIPMGILLECIIQAFRAISHMHRCHIIHRGITSSVFRCHYNDNDTVKLTIDDFQTADYLKKIDPEFLKNSLTDLQFNDMPTRWSAPESFLYGTFNARSDVWMCCMLADEILNHGACPFSEFGAITDDVLMKNVVFTNLRPQGVGRPDCIHSLLLEGLHREPLKRMTLQALESAFVELGKILHSSETNACYENVAFNTHEVHVLEISEPQTSDATPLRGVPKVLQHYRASDQDPDDIFHSTAMIRCEENQKGRKPDVALFGLSLEEDPASTRQEEDCFTVEDKVTTEFTKDVYPHLRELDKSIFCVVDVWPPKLKLQRGTEKLVCRYPVSISLLDAALTNEISSTYGEQCLPLLLIVARFIAQLHEAGWILRCVRAKYIYISRETKQVFTIKMGSLLRVHNVSGGQTFQTSTFKGDEISSMKRWFPIEVLTRCAYSQETDVYSFGMMVWEVCKAIDGFETSQGTNNEPELQCIPFNDVSDNQLLHHLVEGNIPEKPDSCPLWLYQDVVRPCLRHQRIDRPTMEDIVCILQERLGTDAIYLEDHDYAEIGDNLQRPISKDYLDDSMYENIKEVAEPPPLPEKTHRRNVRGRVNLDRQRFGLHISPKSFRKKQSSSGLEDEENELDSLDTKLDSDSCPLHDDVFYHNSNSDKTRENENYFDFVDDSNYIKDDRSVKARNLAGFHFSQIDKILPEKSTIDTQEEAEEEKERPTSVAQLRLLFSDRSDTGRASNAQVVKRRVTTAQAPVKRTENKKTENNPDSSSL